VNDDRYPGLDVDDPWQAVEACFAQDWTDGLPVVPPTAALVEQMLAGGPWRADAVLLHEPVRDRAVTAWHAAINAVMAGCRPEYFPVVGAALAAIGDPDFTLHGPATSTGGAAGVRANATIGRALRLVLLNALGCRPGVLDQSTQGWAGKYTLCFAEHETASPWEPLHVSRGFRATQSAVTVFAVESGHNVLVHAASEPETLLVAFADAMAGLASLSPGRSVIVLAPEHAQHLTRAGWSRARTQAWLYEHARRPLADLKRAGKVEAQFLLSAEMRQWLYARAPGGVEIAPSGPDAHARVLPGDEANFVHRGLGPDDILICAGGGAAGGHSAFFPSWSRGRSVPFITKEVPV
jgi:hypothetical protein